MSRTTSKRTSAKWIAGSLACACVCCATVGRIARASELDPELEKQLATANEGDLDPLKVGFRAGVFAPGALIGVSLAFAWEPEHWLEENIGLAFTEAKFEEPVAGSQPATGEAGGEFFYFLTRFWLGRRHAAVLSVAPVYTYYAAEVSATDLLETFHYRRQGAPFTLLGGASYGYRSGIFRATIGGGVLLPLAKLRSSEAIATGGFPDAVGLKSKLDDDTDSIAGVRLYAELSLGLLFY